MANFKSNKNNKKRRMCQAKHIKWYRVTGGKTIHFVTRTIKNRRKAATLRNTKGYLCDIC